MGLKLPVSEAMLRNPQDYEVEIELEIEGKKPVVYSYEQFE
eukprot:CAMPEP_0116885006 /NCGR_PEP_ID=MMETSP0463-20121206/18135_1 /TAXON_ID=181622 /ORGANISM="Strombidinopsis sp, Strain SopsisLIS2011" /LENGTH=40 /DNA_ID= /DNA_START= /DNA_END= /DNA_ORIENTATION=